MTMYSAILGFFRDWLLGSHFFFFASCLMFSVRGLIRLACWLFRFCFLLPTLQIARSCPHLARRIHDGLWHTGSAVPRRVLHMQQRRGHLQLQRRRVLQRRRFAFKRRWRTRKSSGSSESRSRRPAVKVEEETSGKLVGGAGSPSARGRPCRGKRQRCTLRASPFTPC